MKEPPFPVQADTCQIQQQSHCILVLREEPIFLSLWPALIYCSTPAAFCVISPAKLATECSIPTSPSLATLPFAAPEAAPEQQQLLYLLSCTG